MGKRGDLSEFQKGMIIGFRAKGGSISETAQFVNCSRAAVVKVYGEWINGTLVNKRRGNCGAPRAIDVKGERRLRGCVREDEHATVEQLTARMNQGATRRVSKTTVQRTLLRMGLRSSRVLTAPLLTKLHPQKKLQYRTWIASHRTQEIPNHPPAEAEEEPGSSDPK
ncbi:leydig cell tumor 10 kDa protein homolog isoform X1 [Bufo gargarizans]|uniref:leydig cell tumor 10 kDa protein homolog isoform X1 n=1 Tax=Bufo gargarizans TaxID=30331 RepID=UPI001CF16EC7|nr:leydig cell tumor 10 kDa protein homolog isoform X1 [Bufo gargarizans]